MLTSEFYRSTVLLVFSALVTTSFALSSISDGGGISDIPSYECEIPFSSKVHIGYQWPLVFHLNGSFYDTVNVDGTNLVAVPSGEEVILSCGPNYIKFQGKLEKIQAKCGEDGRFQLNGQTIAGNLKNITCDLRVIEETTRPVYGCPTNLTSTHFGYVHPLEGHTYVLGESCYDLTAGKTYFAHVKLGGPKQYLQRAEKTYLLHNHPSSNYKIEFFKALLFDKIYERIRNTLGVKEAPGFKLSSYVDEPFLMHSQMIAIKKLSWNYFLIRDKLLTLSLLKEDIRDLSKNMELEVFIGSHGVNVIKNSNGAEMEFYADEDEEHKRFPMPELIWILVKNADKAVVFGVFNDPDIKSEDVARKSICKSECEKITWLTKVSSSKYQGPLICCQYEDFIKVIKEVPIWNGINGLLASP